MISSSLRSSLRSSYSPSLTLLWISCAYLFYCTEAISCGGALTTSCLGDVDIRYDPKSSNAAVDQSDLWKQFIPNSNEENEKSSYFVGSGEFQVALSPTRPTTSIPIPLTFFENITIIDSRVIKHRIIYVPAYRQITLQDIFQTTTFQKDGVLQTLGTTLQRRIETIQVTPAPAPAPSDITTTSPSASSQGDNNGNDSNNDNQESRLIYDRTTPIDDRSYFHTGSSESFFNGKFTQTESLTFLQPFNSTRIVLERLETLDGITRVDHTINVILTRNDRQQWIDKLTELLETAIPLILPDLHDTTNNTDQSILPIPSSCLTDQDQCPTESDWCTQDPSCESNTSPFQEPPASIRSPIIVAFCVAAFVLLFIIFYSIHLLLVRARVRRYKHIFARRIADTIQVRKSISRLSPQALADEFKKIDKKSRDGKITKEELWDFMSTGKAGELNRSDFNSLFAAIDLDHNGYVDFLEFCAFLGNCHDEYRQARHDRGSFIRESSRRLSSFMDLNVDDIDFPEEEEEEVENHKDEEQGGSADTGEQPKYKEAYEEQDKKE